jgi:two-component system, NtrC family, sensor kinase
MENQAKSPVTRTRSLSLQTKFSVGIVLIMGLFTGLLSYGLYKQLEESLIRNVYEKSEIILAELEATRNYVSSTLRPKISSLIPNEEFVLEAMSTSYVSRQIMERFQKAFPEFGYKRAAIDSRGPMNEADEFERKVLSRFRKDRNLKEWQGLVTRNRERFFVRMVPIRMEAACLRCHGGTEDAPARLISLYGPERGFGRKLDDVAGMDVLSFPVERAMGQMKSRTAAIIGPGIAAILVAAMLVIVFFRRLVVNRMAVLAGFFSEFVSDDNGLNRRLKVVPQDEIGEVCKAFNRMADRLRDLMKERTDLLQESISQRERIRSVFDGITDQLMLIAPDHTVLMANSASLIGKEPSLGSSKCFHLIHELSTPCAGCLLDRTLRDKVPTFGELSHADGETYLAHYYPILDKRTGEVESVVHYCKSITEKKKMDQQMMHAEKLASLGQLVAGVAHELNNPLGLILFYAELLKKELHPASEHLPDVDVIARHAETCRSVVQDLLEFSRNAQTVRLPGQLNDTIARVISVLHKQFAKEGIRIETSLAQGLPMIPLNESKLQQVWMNLLLNAKQAMGDRGGLITVTTRHDHAAGMLSVIVEDNGEGMAPEIIHRIFDPFFTTKKDGEGTGLGLSVSYGIIKEHGGDITVESRPSVGSVFTISLPDAVKGRDHGEQRTHA